MSSNTISGTQLKWRTWQDWTNLVLGVILAVAPAFADFKSGAGVGWAVTLGIVILLVALWALATEASQASEWVQVVAGVIAFLAPWFGAFSGTSGAWFAWIIGVLVVVLAIWALAQYSKR
ncbi:hypothetical protein GCM10009785_15170 [Brooklawnia cerclae]|uniref:Apolipoprotein N-acyltransferase n=1 Tax=Brooklawnia cerclae TaxID=349934 RepID=A0ABX0SMC5_9ACTN|nr:SPW repeat protein [Brooklawnia cerclae]NIH57911.1 apolipoprotein N-acyltransferase [Brooklawnia cerclae]